MARKGEGKAASSSPPPGRSLRFTPEFFDDLLFWIGTNPRVASRLVRLLRETEERPFQGIGKPEPLRHKYHGYWSRRLTDEHRIVYRVTDDMIEFMTARFHYGE